ncbi:MAG: hypothetical protein EOP09_20320, partial [Proteobacteria bacterium]
MKNTGRRFGNTLIVAATLFLFLFLVPASPLIAQSMPPSDAVAVQKALDRGKRLYAFDQAAWHATDAFHADEEVRRQGDALTSRLGGWIVRKAEPDLLEVLFFDKSIEDPRQVYIVRLSERGTKVVSNHFVAEDSNAIDPETMRMIRARHSALDSLEGKSVLRCADKPFNIAVLPPEEVDRNILVYILTPQVDVDRVPFGGHARIMVDQAGVAGPIHPFTISCLDFPTRNAKDPTEALVATQLLDPIPTEIGVFTMFAAGLPLVVGTPDGRAWLLAAPGGDHER